MTDKKDDCLTFGDDVDIRDWRGVYGTPSTVNSLGTVKPTPATILRVYETTGQEMALISVEPRGELHQVTFTVGVQHFDIGPQYPTEKEAEWLMDQYCKAQQKFVLLVAGVTLAPTPVPIFADDD